MSRSTTAFLRCSFLRWKSLRKKPRVLVKLNVAVLKVMMGKNWALTSRAVDKEILEAKATEANYPYIVALDELGYYFADGIAVMFAQARSLGFAMIAAAQDIEKLTEGARAAEAGAMLANQVTKVFMRIDDANKTNEMIQKYLDKVTVALRKTYEWSDATGFKRVPEVSIEEIAPLTLKNLQSMKAGQGVINTMGTTVKIASLYVGDFLQKYKREWFHINRFLQVRSLRIDEVENESLPINVLSDPYVKGYKLLEIIAGAKPTPDPLEVAAGKAYEAQVKVAAQMFEAVAKASQELSDGVGGAQRAIHLFQAAKDFLVEAGRISPDNASVKSSSSVSGGNKDALRVKSDKDLVGMLSSDAATGSAASGGFAPANPPKTSSSDDPFAFLNDDCPLERRPAEEVLENSDAFSKLLSSDGVALEVAQAIKNPMSDVDDESLDIDKASLAAAKVEKSDAAIRGGNEPKVFGGGVAHDGDAEEDTSSRASSLRARRAQARRRATSASQWLSMALEDSVSAASSGGAKKDRLSASSLMKSDAGATDQADGVLNYSLERTGEGAGSVVGLRDETRGALESLEKTLGNEAPGAAVAAIEKLVAQQATPEVLDAQDVDMSDIQKLLEAIEMADKANTNS